jgi:large subunit ribosomal protein L35
MPKIKTRKSLSKRVKVTASGKLMRHMKGINHIKSSKTKARLRKARQVFPLHETLAKKVKQLINQ